MKVTARLPHLLIALCFCLLVASPSKPLFAREGTIVYTSAPDADADKHKPAQEKGARPEKMSLATAPAPPVVSLSLEPKGKATLSQNDGRGGITRFAQWKQSGSEIVLTFRPEDHLPPMKFSKSGSKISPSGWDSAAWGGAAAPVLHRESSGEKIPGASKPSLFHF